MNDLTFCQHRLPCGHCERLDRMCPYRSGSNYINVNPLAPPYILTGESPDVTYNINSTGITSTECSGIHPDSLINISTDDTTYDIKSTGIASSSTGSGLHPNSFITARNNLEKGS